MRTTSTLLAALLLAPLVALHTADVPSQTPNIVNILADDLNWGISPASGILKFWKQSGGLCHYP